MKLLDLNFGDAFSYKGLQYILLEAGEELLQHLSCFSVQEKKYVTTFQGLTEVQPIKNWYVAEWRR
jgi:hypothetical protein